MTKPNSDQVRYLPSTTGGVRGLGGAGQITVEVYVAYL